MTSQTAFEDLKSFSTDFADETVSLYVPRPSVETHGEKWRILKKNLLSELQDHEGKTDKIEAWLEGLELSDFLGLGKAAFQKDDTFKSADLSARPRAVLTGPGPAFVTPLLADLKSLDHGWIVEINRDTPKLWYSDGYQLSDLTERLDAPEYADVLERRDIQSDVFFHSASRGGVGRSKFHSLGTSQGQEEDKTDEAFYRDVWAAVVHVIPAQVDRIHVVGPEGTADHFAEYCPNDHWTVAVHHSGDGAESLDLGEVKSEPMNMDDRSLVKLNKADLNDAAVQGRIASLFVRSGEAWLEEADSGKADEHTRIETVPPRGLTDASNGIVVQTMQQGGDVFFVPTADNDGDLPKVELRW